MGKLALIVSFTLKPGERDTFLRLVNENAAASVREESGCHRFDVLTAEGEDQVLLYEIYADAAAFDRHLETEHFNSFDVASRDLVAKKSVSRFVVLENT